MRGRSGETTRLGRRGPWELFAVVLVAYGLLALAAYELFGALTIGVTFFPPAGLTFACLLLLPLDRWWVMVAAIVIGEVAVNVAESRPLAWSFGWAAANAAEPVAGALVARAIPGALGVHRVFARRFTLGGLVAGPAVGATIGATVLAVSDELSWFHGWGDIWVGDALGVLVVAPVIVVFASGAIGPSLSYPPHLVAAATAAVGALGVLCFTTESVPVGYAAIPVLFWIAVALGARALAVGAAAIAACTTAATARGRGPWAATDELDAASQLGRQQTFLLVAIGGAWVLAVEVRHRLAAVAQTTAANAERDRALEAARFVDEVQHALLPPPVLTHATVDIAGFYQPATDGLRIGGDWYDMVERADGSIDLVVGDVVGHGVAAATLMGQLSSAARAIALDVRDPGQLLEVLDDYARITPGARGSTAVCATLDPRSRRLTYSRAGHPPPLVRRPDGTVVALEGGLGPPLTWDTKRRTQASELLEPGSVVLLYTDGLIEWRGSTPNARIELLAEHFAAIDSGVPGTVIDDVVRRMTLLVPPTDDIAALCVRVR